MFGNKKSKILQQRLDFLTSRVDDLSRILLNLLEENQKKQEKQNAEIQRLKACLEENDT